MQSDSPAVRPKPRLQHFAEVLMVLALAGMVIAVFVNVVLRYVFDTGITFTEEVSRMLFVWLTFIGSIVALRQGTHLGMDTVVSRLPHAGKLAFFVLSHLLMLGCIVMLWLGCWEQTRVNLNNHAPVSGIPVAAVYSVGLVAAVLMGITLLANLWQALRGDLSDAQLVTVRESEDRATD